MVKFEFEVDDADAELIFDGLRKLQTESREAAAFWTAERSLDRVIEWHRNFVKHIDGLIPKMKNTKVAPSTAYDKLSPLDPRD